MADKKMKNVKCLVDFRLKGQAVRVGDVVAKDDFGHRGNWQNLCNMTPPRAEETDEAVGKAKPAKKSAKSDLPGVGD